MSIYRLALLVLLLFTTTANAQDVLMQNGSKDGVEHYWQFNWPLVEECARQCARQPTGAGAKDMTHPDYRQFDWQYRNISQCRLMLAARKAGELGVDKVQSDPNLDSVMCKPIS